MVAVLLVVSGVPLARVVASPVPVAGDEGSLPAPGGMDAGGESFSPQLPEPYTLREVRTPDPVSAVLTANSERASVVAGLPVSVRVIADQKVPARPGEVAADAPVGSLESLDVRVVSLDAATVEALGGEVFGFGVNPVSGTVRLFV